uniref:Uncharacterized protein n=1 Tax=Anguilla anguilla TaxID=7936 RepID=A0A0E9PZQ9_ANGAN
MCRGREIWRVARWLYSTHELCKTEQGLSPV